MRSKPSIVRLDQLAQAAQQGVNLAVEDRTMMAALSEPTLPPGTMGMFPSDPIDDGTWY